MACQSKQ